MASVARRNQPSATSPLTFFPGAPMASKGIRMFHSPHTTRRRTASAVVAASATVIAGLAFAASPAQAATVFITSQQVDTSETRATGHNEFNADGVRVWTEGSTSTDKAAGYFAVDQDLATAGEPSMDSVRNDNTTTLKPGMQLVTDFDGNGSADGILVGEPTYANGTILYGDNWWASNGSKQFVKDGAPSHGGGFGSTNNGTLDQWRTAFPDADILAFGWSVGSGVRADDTIRTMTLGGNTYDFVASGAPVATDVEAGGPYGEAVSVQLKGFDPDGGPVTYRTARSTDGYVRLTRGSDTATFRPRYGFAGSTSFEYTVTDAEGLTDTGTATITIEKASATMALSQRNTYARNTAYVAGRITTKGNPRGGVLTVSEGGQELVSFNANGRSFRIKVGSEITPGQHTYDVSFAGSQSVEPTSASVTLTVR